MTASSMALFPKSSCFSKQEKGGVTFFSSANLPFPHGFSTRLGGVSSEAHLKSMNLGYQRGDPDQVVDENYRRFFSAVFSVTTLENRAMAPQIHSDILHYADKGGLYPEGDGFFTDVPGVILTVKVADCVPILLAAPQKGLIAALHAGWRGTVAGIAQKGVEALVSMGASPDEITCAIGASIRPCCYEVGQDFYETVEKLHSSSFALRHIVRRRTEDGTERLFADVAGMNRHLLEEAGVKSEHIALSPDCTACQNHLFFSHRASGGKRGTMVAAIMLP